MAYMLYHNGKQSMYIDELQDRMQTMRERVNRLKQDKRTAKACIDNYATAEGKEWYNQAINIR